MGSAEKLPVELWLPIFSYLEAHDLFNAFNNLNSYFNGILDCSYLSFYLNLEKNDNNHLKRSTNAYWSDSVLHRVIYFKSANETHSNYFIEFLRWHYKKLIQVQSLTFPIDIAQVPVICQILPEIVSLEYISLTCIMTPTLFQCILSIPTLRVCQLKVKSTTYNHDFYSETNSNIEIFYVTLFEQVSYSCITLLLYHMPKLKKLQISCTPVSIYKRLKLCVIPSYILPQLQVLKYKFDYSKSSNISIDSLYSSTCNPQYLIMKMPNLEYFYLNIYNINMNEHSLTKIINISWIDFKHIKQVRIIIQGSYHKQLINKKTLNEYGKYLLSKNNQLNHYFNIQWLTTNSKLSPYSQLTIEITSINN